MDRQTIFTRIRDHLLSQNFRCQDLPSTKCLYRNNAGAKCAIGCLIPDDRYDPKFEDLGGLPVNTLVKDLLTELYDVQFVDLGADNPGHFSSDYFFLDWFQFLHDQEPIEKWESLLREKCEHWNLKWE